MSSKLDSSGVLKAIHDDTNNALKVRSLSGFVFEAYNTIELTYVPSGNGAGEIQTAVYKQGATTVATVTLTYNASNEIATIVRS